MIFTAIKAQFIVHTDWHCTEALNSIFARKCSPALSLSNYMTEGLMKYLAYALVYISIHFFTTSHPISSLTLITSMQ